MRRLAYIALVMFFGSAVAGCSDDEDAPSGSESPRALPADLCQTIPSEVESRWSLGSGVPSATSSQGQTTAGCEVNGKYLGTDLTLKLSLVSYGGKNSETARQRMGGAVKSACSTLRPAGAVSGGRNDCTFEKPGTGVTRIARSVPAHGVARVDVAYSGDNLKGVAADAEAILTELTINSPDQMGK